MDKWIFISDSESELSSILIDKYINEGYKIITSTNKPAEINEEENNIKYFLWNKKSAISTKNLFLNILAEKQNIEKIIINFPPDNTKKEIHEENLTNIENFIDKNIKAYTILSKEIVSAFYNTDKTFAFILNKNKNFSNYIESISNGAITALINYLFTAYKQEEINICALSSDENSSADLFSSFVIKALDSENKKIKNKFLNFQEKKSLFSSF